MLIDSPSILGCTFQRCRLLRGRADIGELLELVSDILSEVEQQGKFLIDVPEGWVPEKWVKAVRGDTQRGIDHIRTTMKLSDHDVLSAEKRRVISLLRLLVRELHRLWAIGADNTVHHLGYAFHNINGHDLRMPDEPGTDTLMWYFRVIGFHWDELSLEMREGCCRVVGLELQEAEALIKHRCSPSIDT